MGWCYARLLYVPHGLMNLTNKPGVVVDVEVKATVDERFSYWDALCEQIQHLETLLTPEEQRFLNDDMTLIVSRS